MLEVMATAEEKLRIQQTLFDDAYADVMRTAAAAATAAHDPSVAQINETVSNGWYQSIAHGIVYGYLKAENVEALLHLTPHYPDTEVVRQNIKEEMKALQASLRDARITKLQAWHY